MAKYDNVVDNQRKQFNKYNVWCEIHESVPLQNSHMKKVVIAKGEK